MNVDFLGALTDVVHMEQQPERVSLAFGDRDFNRASALSAHPDRMTDYHWNPGAHHQGWCHSITRILTKIVKPHKGF
jgi:hypothetical protein